MAQTRLAILEGYSSKMPIRISAEEMLQLANSTVGYSGADLENLCREAALICLREDIKNTEVNIMEVLYTAASCLPHLLTELLCTTFCTTTTLAVYRSRCRI